MYESRGFIERVEELDDNGSIVTHTETERDNLGRPLTITTGDSRTTHFDYEGLRTRSTDPRGTTTESVVDARDQVVRMERYGSDAQDLVCYEYAPFGYIHEVQKGCSGTGSNVVQFEPDAYGNHLVVNDPALGPRYYRHDGFGNVKWTQDAKGQEAEYDYDELGRLTQMEDADGVSSWVYDAQFVGALYRSESPDGHTVEEQRDQFGRPTITSYTIDDRSYAVRRFYDNYSRLYIVNYPASLTTSNAAFRVRYAFDDFGHVVDVREKNGSGEYVDWRVLDVDHRGRVTNERFRDGTTTERSFDPHTGTIDRITHRASNGNILQQLDYAYDGNLNLESRSEQYLFSYQEESFLYDALDRVERAVAQASSSSRQIDVGYNDSGDIDHLDGVGQYSYDPSNGRLEDAGNLSFDYDANGNVVARWKITGGFPPPPTEFDYNTQDTLRSILSSSDMVELEYDADRNRVLRRSAAEDTKTYYIGDLMEEIWEDGANRPSRRYKVHADGRVVVQVVEAPATSSPPRTRYFLHHDHLGSPTLVTDSSGADVQRMHYDMWGAKRGNNWTSPAPYQNLLGISVGYTGHEEQIDGGLMNMRGRMYDPKIGRFMSGDPIVAQPETLQGWNRYAYVENNPLKFVDPTGHVPAETKLQETNTDTEGGRFVADWICSGIAAVGIGGGCDVDSAEVPVESAGQEKGTLGGEQGKAGTGKGSSAPASSGVGCDERDNRCLRDNAFALAGQRGGHFTKGFGDAIMFALEVLDKASSLTPVGGARAMTAKAAVKTGVWGTIKGWVRGAFKKGTKPGVVQGTDKQFGKKFGEHADGK